MQTNHPNILMGSYMCDLGYSMSVPTWEPHSTINTSSWVLKLHLLRIHSYELQTLKLMTYLDSGHSN